MPFTYVTLAGTYETADDVAASGTIELTPVEPMHNGLTVISKAAVATLNGSGQISKRVAATTDPDTRPRGVTYRVRYLLTGQPTRTRYVSVPHDQGATLDLETLDVLPVSDDPAPPAPTGGAGVLTINGEAPDGSGNVVVSPGDIGAQDADGDLTGLAALTDGYPRRASGAWEVRTAPQLAADLGVTPGGGVDLDSPAFTGTVTAPRFVSEPVVVPYASSLTLNAEAGSLFVVRATGALNLAGIDNGVHGQWVTAEVQAFTGAVTVTLSAGLAPTTINLSGGAWWTGTFRFNAIDDKWWLLFAGTIGSSSGSAGFGLTPFGTGPFGS